MSWVKETKNDFTIYRCLELNNTNLIQAYSSLSFGNMGLHTGDLESKVLQNREKFLADLGLDIRNLVAAQQIHGEVIQNVTLANKGVGAFSYAEAFPGTDALITKEPGVILSIFTADCLPIFIYDPVTPAVSIVHAGWRGTLKKIALSTIKRMESEFGTTPAQCLVAIGPSICWECFQVGQEVMEQFKAVDPEVVTEDEQGFRVNLSEFHRHLFQSFGIPENQILISDDCTSCNRDQFYSYRAEGGTIGRMMGIIALH